MRSVSALGAVFFAAVGIAACGGISGDAVVQVNGNAITKSTFDHWMKVAASSSAGTTSTSKPVVPDPPSYSNCIAHLRATQPKPAKGATAPTESQLKSQCEQQYTALKSQVLSFLISAEWLLGEASERNVSVTQKAVEKQFNTLKKEQFPKEAEFQKFLASTGQTVSDLLLRVKLQLLSRKIQESVTKGASKAVTTAEAQKYYNEHKSTYGQPERRNLLVVLTKTEAQAKSAKSEIQSGKSFASVAKAHSIDPVSKAKGGSLPDVSKGQVEKALGDAVFAAKLNTLSGPVKTPFGYYIFEVKKVLPASQQPFSSEESSIKQQVAAQRQQKSLSTFVSSFRKKWTARTECRPQYMVQDCKGYKAPKTPAVPPATTAVPHTTTVPHTSTAPKKTSGSAGKKK